MIHANDMGRMIAIFDVNADGETYVDEILQVSAVLLYNADDAGMMDALERLIAGEREVMLGQRRGMRLATAADVDAY